MPRLSAAIKRSLTLNLARYREARAKHALLHVEWYCDRSECPAREVEVYLKDFDDTLLQRLTAHAPVCPVCRFPLKLHHVRTHPEQGEVDRYDACFTEVARTHPHATIGEWSRITDERLREPGSDNEGA